MTFWPSILNNKIYRGVDKTWVIKYYRQDGMRAIACHSFEEALLRAKYLFSDQSNHHFHQRVQEF